MCRRMPPHLPQDSGRVTVWSCHDSSGRSDMNATVSDALRIGISVFVFMLSSSAVAQHGPSEPNAEAVAETVFATQAALAPSLPSGALAQASEDDAWTSPANDHSPSDPDRERLLSGTHRASRVALAGSIALGIGIVVFVLPGETTTTIGFSLAELGTWTAAISGIVAVNRANRLGAPHSRAAGIVSISMNVATIPVLFAAFSNAADLTLGDAVGLLILAVILKAGAYAAAIAQSATAMRASRWVHDDHRASWGIAPMIGEDSGGLRFVLAW